MVLDTEKMITTFSAIFTIVIISASGVQNVMNNKFRKLLVNNPFLKHSVLIVSIYSTKTYEIFKFSDNDEDSFKMNIFKSILIWGFFILLFKIEFNLIIIIISLVIGANAIKEINTDYKYKQFLLKGSTYSILIVYVYGLVRYFSKSSGRDSKSIINSILKSF
jgi:hypothetical protein